ncbi:hypothetical protein [Nocardia sp. CC201C]|uniref:hypothetical protein n=1 Tax=Nocardia sp. CC201C TaxID=3044575 RepID=UPI0024A7BC7E|nr:hypothetical protein [Nocardia sp. CC201C]
MSEDVRPEVQEFIKDRSRATAKLYREFIKARGLDIDGANWSDADRADYEAAADALIAEWQVKQRELLQSLGPDQPEDKE